MTFCARFKVQGSAKFDKLVDETVFQVIGTYYKSTAYNFHNIQQKITTNQSDTQIEY